MPPLKKWYKHSTSRIRGDSSRFRQTIRDLGYDYGYPAGLGGGVEPNVVMQLLFDEASGNLYDTVANYELPIVKVDAAGTPLNYQRTTTYPGMTKLSYGISGKGFPNRGGAATTNANVISAVTHSADVSSVWEYWYNSKFPSTNQRIEGLFSWIDIAASPVIGVQLYKRMWAESNPIGTNTTEHQIAFNLRATDGTLVGKTWTFATNDTLKYALASTDDELRKVRVVHDATARTIELFLNGISYGTASTAALAGKTIQPPAVAYYLVKNGASWVHGGTNGPDFGAIHEFRLTIGNATNNSGGPGGG